MSFKHTKLLDKEGNLDTRAVQDAINELQQALLSAGGSSGKSPRFVDVAAVLTKDSNTTIQTGVSYTGWSCIDTDAAVTVVGVPLSGQPLGTLTLGGTFHYPYTTANVTIRVYY